jgi:hypothetical protein
VNDEEAWGRKKIKKNVQIQHSMKEKLAI